MPPPLNFFPATLIGVVGETPVTVDERGGRRVCGRKSAITVLKTQEDYAATTARVNRKRKIMILIIIKKVSITVLFMGARAPGLRQQRRYAPDVIIVCCERTQRYCFLVGREVPDNDVYIGIAYRL